DRGDDQAVEVHLDDARLHVEIRVAVGGLRRGERLPHVQRHAGVGAQAVPEHVVVLELALLGDLRGLGLELLQAHDVRPIAQQPLAYLRLARADAVDVPGRDLHGGASAAATRLRWPRSRRAPRPPGPPPGTWCAPADPWGSTG